MQHLGLNVSRLIRTAYGPFQLGAPAARRGRGGDREGAARPARHEDRDAGAASGCAGEGRGPRRAGRDRRRPTSRPSRIRGGRPCASSPGSIAAGGCWPRRPGHPPDRRPGAAGAVRHAVARPLGRAAERIEDARVLDAFAGTGALGLEALSRGAARAIFLENDRAALAALRANIATCRRGGALPRAAGRRHRSRPAPRRPAAWSSSTRPTGRG